MTKIAYEPSPETTLAVILGAQKWPGCPQLEPAPACATAVRDLETYLCGSSGLGLPSVNVKSFFDDPNAPSTTLLNVGKFIERRQQEIEKEVRRPAADFLMYYVGHAEKVAVPPDDIYCLFVRFTEAKQPLTTSLRVSDLAELIREFVRHLRCYLILDACFSGAAAESIAQNSYSLKDEKQLQPGLPRRGVTLLCSSNAVETSQLPPGEPFPMFTGALLDVLAKGHPQKGKRLSLRVVKDLTAELIREQHKDIAVWPILQSPVQLAGGDIADVPLFPNPAAKGTVEPPDVKGLLLENPYKGLWTFEERDRDVFFGRDTKAQQLCEDLRQNAVLCLVGSSGVGKSSLVYAGVVPRLREDRWLIVPFRPKKNPLCELAQALSDLLRRQAGRVDSPPFSETDLEDKLCQDHGFLVDLLRSIGTASQPVRDVLLFVDQFEELFTNCQPDHRTQFLKILLHRKRVDDSWAKDHLRSLLTLRFDFLEQAVNEREAGLGIVMQQTKPQLLGEMGDDQLRDVIELPAERRGVSFERGLVETILRDIGAGNERGKLPLLEFCLQHLWLRQRHLGGRVLSRQAYQDIGGFQGAVTQYADQVFTGFLNPSEQVAAPALFVHLVNVSTSDDQGGDTRRPVAIKELIGDQSGIGAQGQSLVAKLVDKRLLVKGPGRGTGPTTVELAHEILIQAWQRLKGWVDENRDFLKKLRHVEVELQNGQTLTGPLLDECESWLNDRSRRLLPRVVRFIEQSLEAQAEAQLGTLLECKVATLPRYIEQLKYRPTLAPILRQRLGAERDHERRRRLSLALITMEEGPVDYLKVQLLLVEPTEYAVVCEALEPYSNRLRDELWQVALGAGASPGQQLRAACALARYDPKDPRWAGLATLVANLLVIENPLHVAIWLDSLRQVRDIFLGPLASICKNPQQAEAERALAATILADCAADRPEVLADVLVEAGAKEYALLWPAIQAHREQAKGLFEAELARDLSAEAQPEASDALARRQAQAAVALLRLGEVERVWPLLRQSPDPDRRTYLVHALGPLGSNADVLLRGLESVTDQGVQRALILSLGEFHPGQLPEETRNPLVVKLLQWYRDHEDPGIHGAIDWLLRYGHQGKVPRKLDWGQGAALTKIDQELAEMPPGLHPWYVNREGLTFAMISGPERFWMGAPDKEKERRVDETAHQRRISRRFWIATKPVNVAQFARFQRENPCIAQVDTRHYSPTDDCPQTRVTWFEAVAYCNWLSGKEGIPRDQWCYQPNGDKYSAGMTVAANHLSLSGYRLPTEAEWEFSCRAGSITSRHFGDSVELLGQYAWYNKNANDQTWPVASLKPNDNGLFDTLGNVQEWCQDRYDAYLATKADEVVEDVENVQDINAGVNEDERVLRGGSFIIFAGLVRSADRDKNRPDDRRNYVGFRPARTCT